MPDIKVYIRSEDLDKWNAIEKKSEFIHKALNTERSSASSINTPNIKEKKPSDGLLRTPGPVIDLTIDKKLCKHGSPKGQCFNKESHRLKCNA